MENQRVRAGLHWELTWAKLHLTGVCRYSYANLIPGVDSARSREEFFCQANYMTSRGGGLPTETEELLQSVQVVSTSKGCNCSSLSVDTPQDS